MATADFKPEVDMYIVKAQPFAQPILTHLRELIHKGCPEIEETMKWSRPFFVYRGLILCNIAAFKAHCSLGFWSVEAPAVPSDGGTVEAEEVGSLRRLTSMESLPPDKQLLLLIRQAAKQIANGNYTSPMTVRRRAKNHSAPSANEPAEFMAALQRSKKAAAVFANFSPSCKREYLEWISEAKRPETRDKRIVTAVEWIAEGKQRNWKYQSC